MHLRRQWFCQQLLTLSADVFCTAWRRYYPRYDPFAFSSDLGEVTRLFEHNNLEDAMAKTMRDYGNGSTDYGQMLEDFKGHCLKDVQFEDDHHYPRRCQKPTTAIPGRKSCVEMYDKAQRVHLAES